ncbi:AAA family ATPase [Acinetobacter tibetensis]|uniref:AAA family ATPase n=1 Tax=Acinetobacter tibetensis TaxID=2943497 RepID=UPI003A4D5594
MRFLELGLQNFLTIGKAEIDLADRGLILIQGENEQDSSAKSNGAGKSSIVDGLCWVLHGVTARGITGDSVVNRTAKKECVGMVKIEDDGAIYRVTRHRKHSANKNALFVDKLDAMGMVETSMTKGTDKETQEVVNTILGCSYEVFTSSIYAGQEKMPDLPAMTDKFLKVLIEEAAGVQMLEKAHEIARAKLKTEKLKADEIKSALQLAIDRIHLTSKTLEDTKQKEKEFDETKRDRVKAKLAGVLAEQEAIKQAEDHKAKFDEPALLSRKSHLEAAIASAKATNDAATEKHNAWKKSAHEAQLLQRDYDHKANSVRSQVAEIKSINSLVGTGCKECGKTICDHDIEAARTTKRAAAESAAVEAKALKATADAKLAESKELEQIAAAAQTVDVVELSNKVRTIENTLNSLASVNNKINMHNNNIAAIKKAANELYVEANPFTESVKNYEKTLDDLKAKQVELEGMFEKANELVDLHTAAVGVYGQGGVRAHILDTVTPFLNDRTRDYLGALSDGNIHATWTTLTTTAKGDLKEKFSIAVTNDCGSDSFAGLSGGEKRKVRLATALALQDLVASRATKPIQLFIGDEIDDALDEAGIERLMSVLERKARERGTVLVISHNELRDYIDQVIVVQKKGGQSVVSGDTTK